jgi:hypothetical protein
MNRKYLLTTTAVTFASSGMMVGVTPASAADMSVGVQYPTAPVYTPPPVSPISGYLKAYGAVGQASYDEGQFSGSGSVEKFGGGGYLNWWLGQNLSLQADAYGAGLTYDGDNATAFGLAAHLTWRDPNMGALGFMASVGSETGDFGDWGRFVTLAAEGQWYINNLTLYGQVGAMLPAGSDAEESGWYGALEGRYFFTPNFSLTGDILFGHGPGFDNPDYVMWGAQLDWKPDTMPLSLFVAYRGEHHTNDCGFCEWDVHTFMFGAKLFVNQPTLMANDRNGATLLDLNPKYGEFATKFIE